MLSCCFIDDQQSRLCTISLLNYFGLLNYIACAALYAISVWYQYQQSTQHNIHSSSFDIRIHRLIRSGYLAIHQGNCHDYSLRTCSKNCDPLSGFKMPHWFLTLGRRKLISHFGLFRSQSISIYPDSNFSTNGSSIVNTIRRLLSFPGHLFRILDTVTSRVFLHKNQHCRVFTTLPLSKPLLLLPFI